MNTNQEIILAKQKYYSLLKRFTDAGLIYEVYANDDLSICNISDRQYGVFCFKGDAFFMEDNPVMFSLTTSGAEKCIRNINNMYGIVDIIDKEKKYDSIIVLNDALYEHLLKKKSEGYEHAPEQIIDKNWEKEINRKYGPAVIRKKKITKKVILLVLASDFLLLMMTAVFVAGPFFFVPLAIGGTPFTFALISLIKTVKAK